MYKYDEPLQRQSQSDYEDSNSIAFFDIAEHKEDQEDLFGDNQKHKNGETVDYQLFKDNEIRLKAAKLEIDNLETKLEQVNEENHRLTRTKMELLNGTSQQIETMRDELQNMCQQLRQRDATIRKLALINKEGYDPDSEEKTDSNARLSWSNPLGINNPLKNGGLMTFGRSIFSSPVHTITETKKSKIDLVIASSQEIERLRDIIKVLSTQHNMTKNGIQQHTKRQNGLINGLINPGQ